MLSSGWMIKFSFSFGFIIWFDDYIDTIVFCKITSMLSSGWMMTCDQLAGWFCFSFHLEFVSGRMITWLISSGCMITLVLSSHWTVTLLLSSGWMITLMLSSHWTVTLLLSSGWMITFSILFDDIILLDENVLVLIWLDDTFLLFNWCYHFAVW